jgi:hypothetical protein
VLSSGSPPSKATFFLLSVVGILFFYDEAIAGLRADAVGV